MLGNKRPKFKLSFSINEISNIPHTSGYCYIDVLIADSNYSGIMATISNLKPFLQSKLDDDDAAQQKKTASKSPASYHASSRSIRLRTSKHRIQNFKCHFNFTMTCNLKFPLRRKDNVIGEKNLVLRVFYNTDRNFKNGTPVELGMVKLNLAEYLNFNEPVTAKYLLQESKINSILNLTTSLEELPADFEFHTQLQIDDSKHSAAPTSTSLRQQKLTTSSDKSFKIPQFQRKAIFGGLDGVINPQTNALPSSDTQSNLSSKAEDLQSHQQNADRHLVAVGDKTFDDVTVDPVIGNLYKKVLESTWDPELHSLLKITPQKLVDDILDLEEHPEKMEENFNFYRELYKDDDEKGSKNRNGLLSEALLRSNLRSWSVSWT